MTFGRAAPLNCWGKKGNFKKREKKQWDDEGMWVVIAKSFPVPEKESGPMGYTKVKPRTQEGRSFTCVC